MNNTMHAAAMPAIHSESSRFAESVYGRTALMLAAIVAFSLPRISHPLLPYGISGLDVCIPILSMAVIFTYWVNGRLLISFSGFNFIIAVPVLMIVSNIPRLVLYHDFETFTVGMLQAIRRIPAALILLLVYGRGLERQDAVRLLKVLIVSMMLAGLFFVPVSSGYFPSITPKGDLMGNPIYSMIRHFGLNPASFFVNDYRMAGNTGSPTTFGVLCGSLIILALDLSFTRKLSIWYLLSVPVFFLLLFATAAKGVYAALLLSLIIYFFRSRYIPIRTIFSLFILSSSLGFLILVIAIMTGTAYALLTYGLASLSQRSDLYLVALQRLSSDPWLLLVGEGWRSQPVGWHSEIVEIFMGFGLFLGSLFFYFEYLFVPLSLWYSPPTRSESNVISGPALFSIAVLVLISSIFQDVFFDGNVLFFFSILLSVYFVRKV